MNYKIIGIYKISDTEKIQRVINEKLYRIRKDIQKNENDPWGMPPVSNSYGRFDKNNDILYVAEDPSFLEMECECEQNSLYKLGIYRVVKDFMVGKIIYQGNYFFNISSNLQAICHAINSSYIGKNDIDVDQILKYKNLTMYPMIYNLCVGIEFGEELYEYTNWIGDKIIENYDNGFLYPSSYCLAEFVIGNNEYNIGNYKNLALTRKGFDNIVFEECQICVCKGNYSLKNIIDTSVKLGDDIIK